MLSMLRQQKYVPLATPHHPHDPLNYIQQIERNSQKLKLLINSFRERSLRDSQSLGRDSDLEKNQVFAQNRSLKISRSWKPRKDNISQGIYSPKVSADVEEAVLTNRSTRSYLVNQQKLNKLASRGAQSSQGLVEPKKKQIQVSSPASSTKMSAKLSSQFLVSPAKKSTNFRITNKIEEKRRQLNELMKKKELEQQETFEVQSISGPLLVSHIYSIRDIDGDSNPEEIFAFFESVYSAGHFSAPKNAVIKRYKNCIYYGDKPKKDNTVYRGMIWYFKKSFYYGEMQESKKHGMGIQISLGKEAVVWKGKFQHGKKTGYFSIESNRFKYYGMLKEGEYHGEGHLLTLESEYKGSFCQGVKEGMGVEKMKNKSQYKGEYFNNKFDGEGELKAQDYYYKGMFKCGKPDGRGFQRTDQYQYLGDFVMGLKEGKGKIKTNDGLTMQCNFWNGLAVEDSVKIPKTAKNGILAPNLSKELGALNEQSDEGTIQHVFNSFSRT